MRGFTTMKKRIYYHDTDAGTVVYYGNYLKYLEEARTGYLEDRGFSIKGLADSGTMFVVARQEVDYKYPSFYGDILDIDTRVTNVSAVKIEFENEAKNQNGQLVIKARTILVCVDKNLKPKAIPDELRSKILP